MKLHAARLLSGRPTRDVYVTRDAAGDREFAGFGRPSAEYADAYIPEDSLPLEELGVGATGGGAHSVIGRVEW